MTANAPLYGWYDSVDQASDQPTYDPPHDSMCLYCGLPLTATDVRTISLMAMPENRPLKCYFYRVHRTCDQSEKDKNPGGNGMDGVVMDMIAKREGNHPLETS